MPGFRSRPDAGPVRSDAALLRAVADGDPAAVRRFLDEVAPVVYGFVFARVGGDEATAEDILQETIFQGVKSAAGFRGDAALSTWLCSIARRRLGRFYESERRAEAARRGLHLMGKDSQRDGGADDEMEEFDRRDEVIRALGRLSPVHRQVLVMKYLDGLSVIEISGQVGRTQVQVQSLLQRAREGLRREIGEADG